MSEFKFQIGQLVNIPKYEVGGGGAKVVGKAAYEISPNTYLVRYKRGDGVITEEWITEANLTAL